MTSPESISALVRESLEALANEPERQRHLEQLISRSLLLAHEDHDQRDVRVAMDVMEELLEASRVFSPWRDTPKLTVFGSARTKPDDPLYLLAEELSRVMADRGWVTVSGAGPGIMEASAIGAGRENTLGVNIELPFEQSANPYVDAESRLVEMKYFFTRKVALTRESLAFAVFPGGVGTMDELFELLTLLHTGKSNPAPVVLVDTPHGRFWEQWWTFVNEAAVSAGYLDEVDQCLFRICHSIDESVAEIESFYRNFVGFTVHDGVATIETKIPVSETRRKELARQFPDFANGPGLRTDGTKLIFQFDGRKYVTLRQLIDEINQASV